MELENLVIRLHHSGEFLKNKYSGGDHKIFDSDPDRFSYSVLMECVKEMKYDEIGGVYVPKGKKGGWKLVFDDKTLGEYMKGKSELDLYIDCTVDKSIPVMNQMQPWVIVRPKPSPLAKERNAEKRTFVTLKNINAEKERRINTRKKLQFNQTDDNPIIMDGSVGLSEYLKRYEITGGNLGTETAAGVELVKNMEGGGCNHYEMRRNRNVAANKEKLEQLGLVQSKSAVTCQKDKGKGSRDNDSASEYVPDNNEEPERQIDDEDDNVTSKRTKKIKRQRVEIGAGPRTRSRASKLPDSSENEIPQAETLLHVEVNNPPVVSLKEKLKNLRDGPGSMTAYLELREREKLQLENEIPQAETEAPHVQSQSVDTQVNETLKRKRGKTRMDHVHNREEKKRITLNYLNQPVADNGKLLSEFSNFLGTTVRQFVSLTCASWHQVPEKELLWEYVKDKYTVPEDAKKWVLKSLNDQFRSHKSRIKRDYYYTCKTDEERLEKKPEEVPLSDWKILLKYWGDEKVQATANKNAAARNKITETHTTGPTSFAQIANKLRLKKLENMPADGDGDGASEEQPIIISDADIYLATRKRKEKGEYKLAEEVAQTVNKKIADVKEVLERDGVEAANKLVHGGKEHRPAYLIGRLVQKKEPKSKSSASTSVEISDQYVSDLTTKIRAQLQQEMDEKLDQKVRDMMKMLAEKNPDLKLHIDDSEKSAQESHGDDNVTP